MPKKRSAQLKRVARSERSQKAINAAFGPVRAVMSIVPSRLIFVIFVVFAAFRFPGSRILPKIYSPIALRRLRRKRSLRFSSVFTGNLPSPSARVLFDLGAYQEAIEIIKQNALHMCDTQIAYL